MPKKDALVRRKVERRRRGAPLNHTNSVVNGVWSDLRRKGLDGRSKLAKAMDVAEADLVADLGGNEKVTPQQRILLDRCVYKLAKCVLLRLSRKEPSE